MDGKFSKHLYDHFVPHDGNRHTPHVLRHRALFGYSVLLVGLKVLVITASVVLPSAFLFSSAITSANIVSLTNQTRSSLGLPELVENGSLAAAAQAKANDMIADQYFAHTDPNGKKAWDWIHEAGYTYTLAGENLAVHYQTAEDVTTGWLASPTHRANIVNERFSEIGVGVAHGVYEGFDSVMVVQMFGEPVLMPAEITPEPAEVPEAPAEAAPDAPAIQETTLVATPSPSGYEVSLVVDNAQTVQIQVAGQTQPLQPPPEADEDTPPVWTGTIEVPDAAVPAGGEPLYVEATSPTGAQAAEPVAWIAPTGSTPEMYAFAADAKPEVRLFGVVEVGQLDNMIGRMYFFTIVFLGSMLLVTLLARFEKQRHSVMAHTLLVIILAGTLAVL